jgi:hypothetical protein
MLDETITNRVVKISKKQYAARVAFERITNILFPFEIVAGRENIAVVDQYLADGNMLIVLNNHFSLRDSLQMIQILLALSEGRKRLAGLPLATHQYNKFSDFVYGNMGFDTYPILTPEGLKNQLRIIRALDIPKNDKTIMKQLLMKQLGMHKDQFIASAAYLLTQRGILGTAPEAHRFARFNKFPGESITDIALVLEKYGVSLDKVMVWLVGMGVKGVEDYSEVSKFNVRKQNQVVLSEPVSVSALQKQVEESQGQIPSLDHLCYLLLAQLLRFVASDDYLSNVGDSCLEQTSANG